MLTSGTRRLIAWKNLHGYFFLSHKLNLNVLNASSFQCKKLMLRILASISDNSSGRCCDLSSWRFFNLIFSKGFLVPVWFLMISLPFLLYIICCFFYFNNWPIDELNSCIDQLIDFSDTCFLRNLQIFSGSSFQMSGLNELSCSKWYYSENLWRTNFRNCEEHFSK